MKKKKNFRYPKYPKFSIIIGEVTSGLRIFKGMFPCSNLFLRPFWNFTVRKVFDIF